MSRPEDQHTYQRIAADLRARIRSGELRVGDSLPSQTALRDQYGVHRSTVRQALMLLSDEGLITMPERSRSKVISAEPATDLVTDDISAACAEVIRMFDLKPGATLTLRLQCFYRDGQLARALMDFQPQRVP